jgi:hypothetical protein
MRITRRQMIGIVGAELLGSIAASPQRFPLRLVQASDISLGHTSTPDPLTFRNGKPVASASQWPQRRAEILANASSQMYGVAPLRSSKQRFETMEKDGTYFNGLAGRRQVRIYFEGDPKGRFTDLLIYLPRLNKPVPVILGINFWGNHTLSPDPAVFLPSSYSEDGKNIFMDLTCVRDHHATDACRGIDAHRWPVKTILERGYGLATFYRGDIDPDDPGRFEMSVRAAYPALQQRDDNFSAIGAWAWALQRSLDYLMTDPDVDTKRVVAYGWSRLGKAALWSAASDHRFAALLSQESGSGGVKVFRRGVGEDIHRLNSVFPHWFCQNFRKYDGMDRDLPFDQHLILAAMAPRPVHIASAVKDTLSDPPGEFLSARLATPVYRFLGSTGLPTETMPPPNSPIFGRVGYHIRPGGHDVTDYDWQQYLHFLDTYLPGS